MFWRKLSITHKLFVALAASSAVVIVVMSVLIAISMRSGFAHYLVQAELGRFDGLTSALAKAYDFDQAGWPLLSSNRENWHKFVRANLPGRNIPEHQRRGPRPPPDRLDRQEIVQNSDGRLRRPHPDRPPPIRDPLQLGQRLVLLDKDEQYVAGALLKNRIAGKRPIVVAVNSDAKKNSVSGQTVGWLALIAPEGQPIGGGGIFLRDQLKNLVYASLLALVLAALAAALLSRQLLAPIHRITRATKSLANRKYDTRLANDRLDELGRLTEDFNVLAESLQNAEAVERQWISDTSHELKTPVAILRAGIEALQDGVRKPDQKNLAELHQSVMRLSQLVSDISLLSHARENRLVVAKSAEDLVIIISEAIGDTKLLMEQSGLEIKSSLPQSVVFQCDRFTIRQLIDNLLENARRYTSSPGTVSVQVSRDDSFVHIIVEDTSPAPPQDAYEKMFDRFYRAEPSRSRQYGGSGLGLAICHEIVRAHQGSIELSPSSLGGLKVFVQLPLGEL